MSGCLAGVSTFSNSDKPAGSAGGLTAGVLCAPIGWSHVGQASLPVRGRRRLPLEILHFQIPISPLVAPVVLPPVSCARLSLEPSRRCILACPRQAAPARGGALSANLPSPS